MWHRVSEHHQPSTWMRVCFSKGTHVWGFAPPGQRHVPLASSVDAQRQTKPPPQAAWTSRGHQTHPGVIYSPTRPPPPPSPSTALSEHAASDPTCLPYELQPAFLINMTSKDKLNTQALHITTVHHLEVWFAPFRGAVELQHAQQRRTAIINGTLNERANETGHKE